MYVYVCEMNEYIYICVYVYVCSYMYVSMNVCV